MDSKIIIAIFVVIGVVYLILQYYEYELPTLEHFDHTSSKVGNIKFTGQVLPPFANALNKYRVIQFDSKRFYLANADEKNSIVYYNGKGVWVTQINFENGSTINPEVIMLTYTDSNFKEKSEKYLVTRVCNGEPFGLCLKNPGDKNSVVDWCTRNCT